MKIVFNPLAKKRLQFLFDPKADIKEAVATDAVILKDTSGNKKWSIQHNTNTVKQDFYSPEPDNKLLNGGFETDLSSWTEVLSYVLNDQFTTDLAVGAVHNTQAEPTGGTRTVVDTNSKLSITGGQLSFATGGSAAGSPGIWYPSLTRTVGKVLVGDITTNAGFYFGVDTAQSGGINEGIRMNNTFIQAYQGGNTSVLGSIVAGTAYKYAVVQRTSGLYYFIKGGLFTNWTLLYSRSDGTTAKLYPGLTINDTTDVITADNIRIPTATWLPTLGVTYDTFT